MSQAFCTIGSDALSEVISYGHRTPWPNTIPRRAPKDCTQTTAIAPQLFLGRGLINFRIPVLWEAKDLNFWALPEHSRVPQTMVSFQKTTEGWSDLASPQTTARSAHQYVHGDPGQEATNRGSKRGWEPPAGPTWEHTSWGPQRGVSARGYRDQESSGPPWVSPFLFSCSPALSPAPPPSLVIVSFVHLAIFFFFLIFTDWWHYVSRGGAEWLGGRSGVRLCGPFCTLQTVSYGHSRKKWDFWKVICLKWP